MLVVDLWRRVSQGRGRRCWSGRWSQCGSRRSTHSRTSPTRAAVPPAEHDLFLISPKFVSLLLYLKKNVGECSALCRYEVVGITFTSDIFYALGRQTWHWQNVVNFQKEKPFQQVQGFWGLWWCCSCSPSDTSSIGKELCYQLQCLQNDVSFLF